MDTYPAVGRQPHLRLGERLDEAVTAAWQTLDAGPAGGEPFFFKSHFPDNRVVGGGCYSGFVAMPVSEAWELYGEGNGVASLQEMRTRISRYRTRAIGPIEDPVIGCIVIRDTRFFSTDTAAEPPPGFAPNIVQGKGYDLAESAAGPTRLPSRCPGGLRPSLRHHRGQDQASPASCPHSTATCRRRTSSRQRPLAPIRRTHAL